jgi:hypothetical protein
MSLLPGLAATLLWVRGQFVCDRVVWAHVEAPPRSSVEWFNIFTHRRNVEFRRDYQALTVPSDTRRIDPAGRIDPGGRTELRWETLAPSGRAWPRRPPRPWNRAGFLLERDRMATGAETFDRLRVAVPYWAVIVASLLGPAWSLAAGARRRGQRQRRRQLNLCRRCGYSLAGNASGTCPECGTPVAKEVTP